MFLSPAVVPQVGRIISHVALIRSQDSRLPQHVFSTNLLSSQVKLLSSEDVSYVHLPPPLSKYDVPTLYVAI